MPETLLAKLSKQCPSCEDKSPRRVEEHCASGTYETTQYGVFFRIRPAYFLVICDACGLRTEHEKVVGR